MNLIEQLGGYEHLNGFYKRAVAHGFTLTEIKEELLKYRRQHNIFEVGDKVVHHKFSNIKIYEVCEISGDLLTVFYDRKTHSFKTDIRHATDEEIEAGRRL